MSISANNRAFSVGKSPRPSATPWAMRFQPWWLVSASRHSMATWVWSAVRTVLLTLPSALASLNAAAYSGLVRAGGGPGRNWELLSTAYGVMSGTWALAAGLKSGGVGCHWPGSLLGGVYVTMALAPSLARKARIWRA